MDWKKKEFWVAFTLLALAAIYTHLLRYQQVEAGQVPDFRELPIEAGDWVGTDLEFDASVYDVLKADDTIFRRYVNSAGEEAWLFIGYWQNQKYGAQPHSPLHCLPGSGWNILANEVTQLKVDGAGAGTFDANFAIIANGKRSESMLYWYQTRSGVLANELSVKLDLSRNAMLRTPTDAAFIRITSPSSSESPELQLSVLRDFWQAIAPHVNSSLPFHS